MSGVELNKDDILAKLASVPALVDRSFYIVAQDDLLRVNDQLKYPTVGVVYSGMNPKDSANNSSRILSVLSFDIFFMFYEQGNPLTSVDVSDSSEATLDAVRDSMKGAIAPTGKPWVFAGEVPVQLRENDISYVQRWQTDVFV